MADIIQRTQAAIETEVDSKLLSQFENSTNLKQYIYALLSESAVVESELENLRNALDIDLATGDALDKLGARVGETRQNRADAIYRIYIKGRILVNLSRGTVNDVLAVVRALSDTSDEISLTQYFPAHIHVEVFPETTGVLPDDAVFDLGAAATAAGVGFTAIRSTNNRATSLTIGAVTDYPETDAATGVGNVAGSTGGNLAGAYVP